MDNLSLPEAVALCGLAALALQSLAWLIATWLKRIDTVDSFWGLTFLVIVAALLITDKHYSAPVIIVSLLVIIWGLRLSSHIFRRFLRSKIQDPRYSKIINSWPGSQPYLQALPRIFFVQAVLATLISLPVIVVHVYQPDLNWLTALGGLIWLSGFTVEAVADKQLKTFVGITANKGKLMQTGLWCISRHPNYFGELVQWLGISILALAVWPQGILGLIGLITISALILFVSGIPPAEHRLKNKPDWAEYRQTTSVLMPLPTKK